MPTENQGKVVKGSMTRIVKTWNASSGYSAPTITQFSDITTQSLTSVRTSVSTPGFKTKRRKWTLPMNPFAFSKETVYHAYGKTVEWDTNVPSAQIRTESVGAINRSQPIFYQSYMSLSAAEISSIDGMLRNRLRLKVKDQKVNIAVAFAERDQLAKLLVNTATRITKMARSLRKGNISEAAAALGVRASRKTRRDYAKKHQQDPEKAMASGVLELQYGWRPLLGDVYGSAEALAQAISKEIRDKVVVSTTVERSDVKKALENTGDGFTGPFLDYYARRTMTFTRKYVLYFSTSSPALSTLSQMGITNPALIAWELVPYSFVADWFLPIGTAISSLDATLGLSFEKGSMTDFYRKSNKNTHYSTRHVTGGKFYEPGSRLNSQKDTVTVSRVLISTWPDAALPEFKNPLSLEHAVNAIALLTSTFRK